MNSNFWFPNKKSNKNKQNISKSTLNSKKLNKIKDEAKSTNIEMFQKKNDINDIVDYDINNEGEIKIQEKQKRDHSKKAKKSFVNKNIEKNNIEDNNINMFSNLNNENGYFEKVEYILKTKTQSVNPETKKSKNFLQSSINEYDLFNFKKILAGDNDFIIDNNDSNLLNNELNLKTNLPKKMPINNFLNKREEIKGKNNNSILNQQKIKKPYFLKESKNDNISNNNNQEKKII